MVSEDSVHGTWRQALGGVIWYDGQFSPHDRQEAEKGRQKRTSRNDILRT